MLDRIGLEREFWLTKDDKIVMPEEYGFPIDEFGFLVEIRTHPHSSPRGLLQELEDLTRAHTEQALSLGLRLTLQHRRFLGKKLINCLSKKYHWDTLPDLTANIYSGVCKSHATGINGEYGTAGVHVHFSRHDKHGNRVQLPIKSIVQCMDWKFDYVIHKCKRLHGEYEVKPHGFEYRSLPTIADQRKVVSVAFSTLKNPKSL